MYDIHMHVIPGLDGGPADMEEALAMLSLARKQGVEAVICVARFLEHAPEAAQAGFEALAKAAEARPELRGMELKLGWEARFIKGSMTNTRDQYIPASLQNRRDSGLAERGHRYCVMTEFLPETDYADFGYVLEPLCMCRALLPVILSAEYSLANIVFGWYDRDVTEVARELHDSPDHRKPCGALYQINVQSLVDDSDIFAHHMARWLVDNRLADFAGTGANRLVCDHSWAIVRPGEDMISVLKRQPFDLGSEANPKVRQGIAYIRDHCDPEYAEALLWGNARKLPEWY